MAPSPSALITRGNSGARGRSAEAEIEEAPDADFRVSLSNFEGPFDLLLTLISKHEMDITEVSLSRVTSEFIGYLNDLSTPEELDRASEFIVVAATLLDMKIVSLLPQGEYVDAEDVAILEARDLLFARLLQYKAFKEVSTWFAAALGVEGQRTTRAVPLEPKFRERIPELVWTLSAADFAALATLALAPRETPTVGLTHLHAPKVSIREQARILVALLQDGEPRTFRELVADASVRGVVIARFLALLELYRRAALSFEQATPLGELTVTWDADEWDAAQLASLGDDDD
ncbi:segregation and condensation protein A [Pseudoclavibacter sp. AY1F1]|uniref:segregation and condensation protein A n=1 Tax=Pseudoclavibacter sp. AY1F1 TaxID=2080583 RepID=UPI0026816C0A